MEISRHPRLDTGKRAIFSTVNLLLLRIKMGIRPRSEWLAPGAYSHAGLYASAGTQENHYGLSN